MKDIVEKIAKRFHEVYQEEAKRQGNIRHDDNYNKLPQNIKEFDRALAKFVLNKIDDVCKNPTLDSKTATNIKIMLRNELS